METEYNLDYSLTVDEVKKMDEWERKHNKNFHRKGFGYRGVSPVSNFEVRFSTCSIGVWCDCVCLECLRELENTTDEEKAEKLRKTSSYTIRELR